MDDDVDVEKECLLHAHLACLLDGLEANHIDDASFQALRAALEVEFVSAGLADADGKSTDRIIRAEPMWNLFVGAVAVAGHTSHPDGRRVALADRRKSDADFAGRTLVTIGRLEFQSEIAKRGARVLGRRRLQRLSRADIARKSDDRKALAEIVECCNRALKDGRVDSKDYLKGDAVSITWMTPLEARAQILLRKADEYGLGRKDISSLRDLLGLWSENGRPKRPLAAFFLDRKTGLTAPNVITAEGYGRFRHRPPERMAESPNSGLTYNLDRKSAARHPGACEIVADAVAMSDIDRIEAGGQPTKLRGDRRAEMASHRHYCEEVSRGRTLVEILAKLEAGAWR